MLEIRLILFNLIWSTANFILFVFLIWQIRRLYKLLQGHHAQKTVRKQTTTSKPQKTKPLVKQGEMISSAQAYGTQTNAWQDQHSDSQFYNKPKNVWDEEAEFQKTPQAFTDDVQFSGFPPTELTALPETPTKPSLGSIRVDSTQDDGEFSGKTQLVDNQRTAVGEFERIIQDDKKSRRLKAWNIVGASVQGTSHLKSDLPCQDYHDYRVVADQIILAAVADGLGSASKSEQGAKIAVDTVLNALAATLHQKLPGNEQDWMEVIRGGFTRARAEIEKVAETTADPLREYGTTLIVTIVNDSWLVTGHIGDGAAVAMLDDGALVTICTPQRGEYANQTTTLTASNALEKAKFSASLAKIHALALFSDGIQHLSVSSRDHKPHDRFFYPIFESLSKLVSNVSMSQELAEYLASEQVSAKTDDDKTLVLISRTGV